MHANVLWHTTAARRVLTVGQERASNAHPLVSYKRTLGNPESKAPGTLPAATGSVLLVQEQLHFAVELQTILLQENDVRRLADLN